MSNTKQYFQNLEVIPTVQELDDEVAATCSGGAAVILYEDINFGGDSVNISFDDDNLDNVLRGSGWNNRTSSVRVIEGQWEIFTDDGYKGSSARLYPGSTLVPVHLVFQTTH